MFKCEFLYSLAVWLLLRINSLWVSHVLMSYEQRCCFLWFVLSNHRCLQTEMMSSSEAKDRQAYFPSSGFPSYNACEVVTSFSSFHSVRIGAQKTGIQIKIQISWLMLFLWVIKSFVSNLGVSGLLSVSMKYRQYNFLACMTISLIFLTF